METVTYTNRWSLNPEHRSLGSIEARSLRWSTAFEPCLSKHVRNLHIFSSLGFRLPLPEWCARHFHEFHNDKVLDALLSGRFRCPEGFADKLSEQKSYTDIDRSMKKFLFDGFRDIFVHTCRIPFWVENLTVVRKRSVRHALVNPFCKCVKVCWPKFNCKLKSIPTIFSHNLLYLFALQQFTHKLTGQ